ncbi:hypothetical protein RJ639_045793 [Escallonia herrerae]|uniref:C2H2-type domain-containing protein n=1 Tax=Escallonia herrerae TaxID=1293975 RepID=A0AA89AYK3_9ASTE|nr:hypothetical protein RJ639_045793 [Escallonia herrerae]
MAHKVYNIFMVSQNNQILLARKLIQTLIYHLSVLKDKLHQVQSVVNIFVSPDQTHPLDSAIASMGTLVQDIIITASSTMFTCQEMALGATSEKGEFRESENNEGFLQKKNNIIELDAADLLAKYTHYCHVCGKGFECDTNLRMHIRAHGDEYKSSANLSNLIKNDGDGESLAKSRRKYSCPEEGRNSQVLFLCTENSPVAWFKIVIGHALWEVSDEKLYCCRAS